MTITNLPKFCTYANYSSGNYGAHALHFEDATGCEYWFSYQTLVAFRGPSGKRVVLQNYWSTTTGKHLNCIDDGDKKNRVTKDEFNRLFAIEFGKARKAA